MRTITAFLLATFLSSTLLPNKSHAVVGWLVKSPTTRAVGGVVTASGGVYMLAARGVAEGWTALGHAIGAMMVMGLGLIILDEEQTAEAQFRPIRGKLASFSTEEIATYNDEVDQLNAILQTVVDDLKRNPRLDEKELWLEYGPALAPATLQIASYNGKRLLESMR